MSKNKKDYSLSAAVIPDSSLVDGPCPWIWQTKSLKIDFRRWQHKNGDISKSVVDRGEILEQCRNAIWGLRHEMSDCSIVNLYEAGLKQIILFIDEVSPGIKSISNLTAEIMDSYVLWLKHRKNSIDGGTISYLSARRRYTSTKTILNYYSRQGIFDNKILPINPFPNVRRAGKETESYSKSEMTRIMKILTAELTLIREHKSNFSQRIQLAVYQLLIHAQTGLNLTPLEEASRDCIKPHPLQPDNASILVTYKRRGMNTYAISLRNSQEIDQINNVPNSVVSLLKEVIEKTEPLVEYAQDEFKDRIWLYRQFNTKKVVALKGNSLHKSINAIVDYYNLKDDDGNRMMVSVKRLRKTFATRIWQLTGGDIWKTARFLGNTPQISNRHYLEITPEMEKQHKFVGLAIEISVRNNKIDNAVINKFSIDAGVTVEQSTAILTGKNNTRVARCSDPLSGKYAQNDGEPCTRFLHCFRCPNQIVLESDLYRLFSFYWLVIKQRSLIGKKRWKSLYGWVVREIDNHIAIKFDPQIIKISKQKARSNPHPMWINKKILGELT